jgi:hypothetical protein
MELTYDWKSFQSIFYSKRKLNGMSPQTPVCAITEGQVVVAAFSEGQDLSDWIGATWDELNAEFSHRELHVFDRVQVDQWMSQAVGAGHFYDQLQFLQSHSQPLRVSRSRASELALQKHFLLRALQSWWRIVLPSSYGIYISLDQNPTTSIFLLIQKGRMSSFHVPDLSPMIPDRRRVPRDVVRYISERHLVPVQGVFLTSAEWTEWSENGNPWPQVATALRANRTKIAPFNWGLTVLIFLKAYLGI